MSVQRIAGRYAKSLLDLAIERNEVDAVLEDMNYIKAALKSRDLYLLIKSPIVSMDKKLSIFRKIFSGKIQKTTTAFFEIMTRKGREDHLPEIVDSFIEQYKDYKQISTVYIKTAVALSDDALATIREKLAASPDVNKNLELEVSVDPSLLGGFTLQFEGKQYDSSIATKLKDLRKQFSN
ncbi:MAG: ATP synthase F1 subunit delta [Saprospiraceae bacterium]|nr:ATP synthase F1 subunit delta [Saprospiraceae bacterium]